MSFPRYPKYKDSGVETVGRLCWAETTFAILHDPHRPTIRRFEGLSKHTQDCHASPTAGQFGAAHPSG